MIPTKFIAVTALLLAGTAARADQLLVDGSFEAPVVAGNPAGVDGLLTLSGKVGGWTYSAAGVVDAATAAPFFTGAAPAGYDGSQYAFIRGGGSISQTVVADANGFFSVAFTVAGNPGFPGAGSNQTIDFLIDGVVIQTLGFNGGSDFGYTSDNIPTLGGVSHTISFNGLSGGDDIAFIDSALATVTFGVGFVPEPAS
ncbi:hypothetical protein KX816_01425 [Sphingosinicellaceae bacterium]|nr:hypothetical protein KX816_01425 [Sphingosinicellaceae bacterium]